MAGRCFHCGTNSTLIWRAGPPNKPVLCNDCGSWWAIKGTLEGCISKLPKENAQSNLFPKSNPSSFGFAFGTMSGNNIQAQNTKAKHVAPVSNPRNVSRKKRSTIKQNVASSTKKLQKPTYAAIEEQPIQDEDDPESVLIFERINKYIPENEIGLGCMLLKPPPSPTKDSKAN